MAVVRSIAVVAITSIVGAAPISAQTADEFYQQAKNEKTVVLYGAGPTASHDRWIKEFEQTFPGVTVNFTGGLSPVLNKKIDAQLAAGKIETDLAVLQTIEDFARWKKAGTMMAFKPPGWEVIDEAYKDEDGAFVTVSINPITYAINTQLVSGADVPKSALDFLKPLFAGKLITTDPIEDDAALASFALIVQKYGWEYLEKYAAQKPVYVNGHAEVSNAIASGDKLASFNSTTTTWQLMRAGKPITGLFSEMDATPIFLVGGGNLQGCAASERGQALPQLVSRQGAASSLRRLLGAFGRSATIRFQAARRLQYRPRLPQARDGPGTSIGAAQALVTLHRPALISITGGVPIYGSKALCLGRVASMVP